MVSTGSGPWYNAPARQFPALLWLKARYPFYVSPSVFARQAPRPARPAVPARRRFPAQVWLEARQRRHGGW